MSDSAVMLCGHGSRDPDAIGEFERLGAALKTRLAPIDMALGYLEFARPVIRDGLEALKQRGAKRILAIPGMLFAAAHVKNDLPWEINSFAAENAAIELRFGRELAIEPGLLQAAAARIAEAEASAPTKRQRAESLLLVVGRGTNDPDANGNICKVARFLWEGMGFGWAETAYSGVAAPLIEPALRRALKLGFPRVVVFPYFLFTGVLVKRIYAATDRVAAEHPQIEFLKAPYLGDHPHVLDCLIERVYEAESGMPVMNCQLCKYRTQIVGYEADVAAPQTGHHHHVRGILTDAAHGHQHHPDRDHRHRHEHPHSHDHHHQD